MRSLVLIDNLDSFTYNIVHAFEILGMKVEVISNQRDGVDILKDINPQYLVIGPGPGTPSEAGISKQCILAASIPVLGICLGHQAIGEVFGGKTVRALYPKHGKVESIIHEERGIFKGMPQGFFAARYHSLVIDRHQIPSSLTITAQTEEGEIMAVQHIHRPIYGVQFHPESIATEGGMILLENFLEMKQHHLKI